MDPPDPDDKHHRITRIILKQLASIKELFEQCDTLVRKNCGPGEEVAARGSRPAFTNTS